MNTRQITGIVIHCSGTPNGQWHNVQEIDQWHQAQGFERAEEFRQRFNSPLHAIGYHFVIYPNGAIATGRHLHEVGQHTKNHNTKTIAICLIGADKFTPQQWDALRDNVVLLTREKYYPEASIVGCNQIEVGQQNNPGFDVAAWWLESGMKPFASRIFVGADGICPESVNGASA
ncbi:MAG: N-acetylmuramoyl-L-alanine amidase [Nitrosomonas sp.]|nr:N-acetylmuramoyl-L-alanine amidase [Nitrosomonas sp.]